MAQTAVLAACASCRNHTGIHTIVENDLAAALRFMAHAMGVLCCVAAREEATDATGRSVGQYSIAGV